MQVKPSLLHGDLWSGNMSTVEGGQWAILDPAVYYVSANDPPFIPGIAAGTSSLSNRTRLVQGHHEAEFGMSWCAGFGPGIACTRSTAQL